MSQIHARKDSSGRAGIRTLLREYWLSFAFTIAIAILQVGIFYLAPQSVQTALARNYQDPSWWSWVTYAYVHESTLHLISNITIYLVGSCISWFVLSNQKKTREYLVVVAAMVICGPPIIGGFSQLFYTAAGYSFGYSKGFSGVAIAFGIFAYTAVISDIRRQHSESLSLTLTYGLSAAILLLAATAIEHRSFTVVFVFGAILLLVGLATVMISGRIASVGELIDWQRAQDSTFSLLLISAIIVFLSLITLIPAKSGGGYANVFGHYVGMIYGGLLGVMVVKYT